MKSTFIAYTVAAGLLLAPTQSLMAQSSLPTLGDDTSMSLGAERRLGDSIGKEIFADPEFVSDPVLDAYVHSLWQPLVSAAKQRGELPPEMDEAFAWQLFLIRDKSVNAFALPGGYFGVHLGLISLVDTPDELASVLAHELTHVTQRHIARGMSKQSANSPWIMAGAILAILAASRSTNANTDAVSQGALAATQAAGIQSRLNFSRDMEREADRIGFTLMKPAGYAPEGFVGMFNKLAQAARLSDNGSYPYLRSHPLTTERIADMSLRIQDVGGGHSAAASPANPLYHRIMAARARVLGDLSIDAQKRHTQAALSAGATLPTLYAGALAAGQLKDKALAAQLYSQLQQQATRSSNGARAVPTLLPPAVTDAIRWLGAELAQPVRLDVNSDNRIEMLYAAQAVLNNPQGAPAASARLQSWLANHPKDGEAWQLQSRLQLTLGQTLRAAISTAEAKSAYLDDSAALAQYQAAQSMLRQAGTKGDPIDAAIVDSKVRELQRRVRERLP
jgi:predicted Zn-dependent protease